MLQGKVASKYGLKYTPAGTATLMMLVSIPQFRFKASRGNVPIEFQGDLALKAKNCRIGQSLRLKGSLWVRHYKDRRQEQQTEFRVMAEDLRIL